MKYVDVTAIIEQIDRVCNLIRSDKENYPDDCWTFKTMMKIQKKIDVFYQNKDNTEKKLLINENELQDLRIVVRDLLNCISSISEFID